MADPAPIPGDVLKAVGEVRQAFKASLGDDNAAPELARAIRRLTTAVLRCDPAATAVVFDDEDLVAYLDSTRSNFATTRTVRHG